MLLDLIQRLVRLPVKHVIIRLTACHGRSDTQRHFLPVFLHRHVLHTVKHLGTALLHQIRVVHFHQEDHKFVASQPSDDIIRPETGL